MSQPPESTRPLAEREAYAEVAPLVRRMISLDPGAVVRLRHHAGRLTALVRTPFHVLAARTVAVEIAAPRQDDITVSGEEFLAWLDGSSADPQRRDADWRWPTPPVTGWRHLDDVPDAVIRSVVRSGAQALKDAATREGVPGAEPRSEVADALLDSVVLTITNPTAHAPADVAEVTLRTVSALTRLGFLARDSHARVDLSGRWVRVAGSYGSVYAESAPLSLSLLR